MQKKIRDYIKRINTPTSLTKNQQAWLGMAVLGLVNASREGVEVKNLGSTKIDILIWIAKNEKSLPTSVDDFMKKTGEKYTTTSHTLKELETVGLLKRPSKQPMQLIF